MIKAIIFDLDGTLLNTLIDLYNAVNYTLKINNYPCITMMQTRNYIGNGVKTLIKRAINREVEEKTLLKAYNDFKSYYDVHQNDNTKPYDGIIDVLKKTKKQKLKIAIVSNKYQLGVENLCNLLFDKLIDVMVGSQDGLQLKPEPDMIYYACNKLNLTTDECLFVGDSNVDILTANNAKMKVIAVTWGYKDKEVLERLNPNYLINNPYEIIKIIKGENQNG